MNLFYLIVFLSILILIFIYFYIIRLKFTYISISEGNIELYKRQIKDLKKEYSFGYINADEYKNINNELSRRIINFKSFDSSKKIKENKNFSIFYKSLISFIIILSIMIYGLNGKPNMPDFSLHSRIDNEIPYIYWKLTLEDIDEKIIDNPKDLGPYIIKANILTNLGKTNEAVEVWEKTKKLFGDNLKASDLLSYGEALVNQNIEKQSKYLISSRALKIFQKVSSLVSVSSEAGSLSKFYLSVAALEQGNMERAKSLWEQIEKEVPEGASWKESILLNISKLQENYITSQNTQILSMVEGLEKRLLDYDSNEISDWKRLGRSNLVLGRFEKAIRAYRRAIELNNKDIEAIEGLAEAKLFQNKQDGIIEKETLDLFRKVLSFKPNHPLALWVVYEDEILKGNKFKAINLLEKLIANLPQDSDEYILVLQRLNELKN